MSKSALSQFENTLDLLFRQFGVVMPFPHWHRLQNVARMRLVFLAGHVLQIFKAVVSAVSILVVDLQRRCFDKRLHDDSMDLEPAVTSIDMQGDVFVASHFPLFARQPNASALAGSATSYVALVRDFIIRCKWDDFPTFHAPIVLEGSWK